MVRKSCTTSCKKIKKLVEWRWPMNPIIKIENVSKTFHAKSGEVDALQNINLEIEKGDIYGIIGLSGAGKSTLVRCLNLLEQPTEGKVFVEGKSLSGSIIRRTEAESCHRPGPHHESGSDAF